MKFDKAAITWSGSWDIPERFWDSFESCSANARNSRATFTTFIRSFAFICLGGELVSFPHIHQVHDVHKATTQTLITWRMALTFTTNYWFNTSWRPGASTWRVLDGCKGVVTKIWGSSQHVFEKYSPLAFNSEWAGNPRLGCQSIRMGQRLSSEENGRLCISAYHHSLHFAAYSRHTNTVENAVLVEIIKPTSRSRCE